MLHGTIEKIVMDHSFGFIRAADGRQIFFHRRALTATAVFDALQVGQAVTFDLQADSKRPRAAQLMVV